MICLASLNMSLDLVYQLECLLYDIRRLYAFVFHFSVFFKFYARLNLLVKS